MVLDLDEETKNSTTGILCKICMTLKIYVELNISNLNVNLNHRKLNVLAQSRSSNCTKTVRQLNVINF